MSFSQAPLWAIGCAALIVSMTSAGSLASNETSKTFPTAEWTSKAPGKKASEKFYADEVSSPLSLGGVTLKCNGSNNTTLIKVSDNNKKPVYWSCFDVQRKTPIWTAHELTAKNSRPGKRPAVTPWFHWSDKNFGNGKLIDSKNSKQSFDLGHLTPRGDFAANQLKATSTFTILNRAPQDWQFNEYGWKCAETLVRKFQVSKSVATKRQRLIIVTGTEGNRGSVPEKDASSSAGTLTIPNAFWKVVIDPTPTINEGFVLWGVNSNNAGAGAIPEPETTSSDAGVAALLSAIGIGPFAAGNALIKDFEGYVWPKASKSQPKSLQAALKAKCATESTICPGDIRLVSSFSLPRSSTRLKGKSSKKTAKVKAPQVITQIWTPDLNGVETVLGCSNRCQFSPAKKAPDTKSTSRKKRPRDDMAAKLDRLKEEFSGMCEKKEFGKCRAKIRAFAKKHGTAIMADLALVSEDHAVNFTLSGKCTSD